MSEPDRDAFARRHAAWLIPVFLAAVMLGLLRENLFAVVGGVLGLGWVGRAIWIRR